MGFGKKPCLDEDEAFEALIAGAAVTLAGLLAKLDYLQNLDNDDETEWMLHERIHAPALIESFVASLKNIGVQS